MRHLVTFIVRLWIDTEANAATCEGQAECVTTGERVHVRSREDIVRFIDARLQMPEPDQGQTIILRDE